MYQKEVIKAKPNTQRLRLLLAFHEQLKVSDLGIENFTKELKKDPSNALRWADTVFMHGAKRAVAQQMIHCLEHCTVIADITETLRGNIMSKARYTFNKSTSPSSNYMEECQMACNVEALEKLEHIRDLEEDYFR